MMSTLTEEQRKRIEGNRRRALEIRAFKSGFTVQSKNQFLPVVNNSSEANFNINARTGLSASFQARPGSLFPTKNILPQMATNSVTNNAKLSYRKRFRRSSKERCFQRSSKERCFRRSSKERCFRRSSKEGYFRKSSKGGHFQKGFKGECFQRGYKKRHFIEDTINGHCVLLTRKRFYVDVGFHEEVTKMFKLIPSKLFDSHTKNWNFSIDDHDNLITLVKPLQPNVFIVPLPHRLLELFKETEETKQIKEYNLSQMDPTLVNALLPFQKVGLYFGIQHGGRVLLADDMGLGKTIQGIAIANYFIKDWPLLVVTPSSLRYTWLEAFQTWLPTVESHEINVINSSKDHIPNVKVVIMSYDLLFKMQSIIINGKFKSVIFDESHFLKNHKAYRTKAALSIMKNMVRIVMLSGTPALSRPIELFTQISALCPKYFSSFNEFVTRYCKGRKMPWGWEFCGSSNMGELQIVLEELVMFRRLKSDVLSQLPAKSRQMIILDPSRISSSKRKSIKVEYEKMCSSRSHITRRAARRKYFIKTGSLKIPAVCDYIRDLLESERKFLCFAHHQEVMNSICNTIDKKKIDYIRIDGSVPSEQRNNLCDYFQSNDTCKVAVLSITAANCGITLTAASLVVFAELFWNPGILTQAEDRAHRIGQEDHVVVQYLIAKGTADDEMWALVQRKLNVLNKVGLSKDSCMSADTIIKDHSNQIPLDDFVEDFPENDDFDADSMSVIPEKRFKPDL